MTVHILIMDRDTDEVLEDFIAHSMPGDEELTEELAAGIKESIQQHYDTDE